MELSVDEGLPIPVPQEKEEKSEEYVSYSKTKTKGDATVTVSANAKSMQELHDVLKLAGITLPKDKEIPMDQPEPEADEDPREMPCDPPEEMDPDAHSAMPMSTDKAVITGVLKDRLRDYLRNGR